MGKKRMIVSIIPGVLKEINVKLQANIFEPVLPAPWKSLIKGIHKKYDYYNEGRIGDSMMVRAYEGGQIMTMRDESQGIATLAYIDKERSEKTLIQVGLKKSDDSEF